MESSRHHGTRSPGQTILPFLVIVYSGLPRSGYGLTSSLGKLYLPPLVSGLHLRPVPFAPSTVHCSPLSCRGSSSAILSYRLFWLLLPSLFSILSVLIVLHILFILRVFLVYIVPHARKYFNSLFLCFCLSNYNYLYTLN